MFDKTIEKILDQFGVKTKEISDNLEGRLDGITESLRAQINDIRSEFSDLSESVKMVLYISVGLSLVDTILLFAILKKLK